MTSRLLTGCFLATFLTLVAGASPSFAISEQNILLVINTASPESVRVGEHYARRRTLPDDAILRLAAPTGDEISRDEYARTLKTPLIAWFARQTAHDRICCIVLTKGVPLRIAGTPGRNGTLASVDSELALLYRRMAGKAAPPQGFVPNPYFAGDTAVGEWRPFSHEAFDIFLVTRLDGYSVDDVLGLIDRGQAPSADGHVVLDMKAALQDRGNQWLQQAADRLTQMGLGDRVVLDTTSTVVRDQQNLLGYYSWGSNDPGIQDRDLGNRFAPGALAGQFVSTDGRTFREPPPGWRLGRWPEKDTHYAASPQSLAGDLVRQGVTGVSAQVAEPFFDATVRPEILFPAWFSGFTLAEAYYLAIPYLSWQTIVVGDPLATLPVQKPVARPGTLDPGLDPATEFPVWYSRRRMENLGVVVKAEAARGWLLAESRRGRGDEAGSRKALEEATAADPRLTAGHLLLATDYERDGRHDEAIARYRAVLEHDARNVVALNNLAYAVAVRQKRPADALPHAERAAALAPASAPILDTLAWVHHLLGHKQEAARAIAAALRLDPTNDENGWHGAAILAAGGEIDRARKLLADVLARAPALADREEIKQLQQQLRR